MDGNHSYAGNPPTLPYLFLFSHLVPYPLRLFPPLSSLRFLLAVGTL